jgi:dihydropteroate synthase
VSVKIAALFKKQRPLIMGILNLTPDSFSVGDPEADVSLFLRHAETMFAAGCDVLDVGGESTRPGAAEVTAAEELKRILPFLQAFRKQHPDFPISLDTKKYEVAKALLPYQIDIINDVSFLADTRLAHLAGEQGLFYVLMHTRGTPQTMVGLTDYPEGLLPTIFSEINIRLQRLAEIEFPRDQVILDPGFGFAKTPEQCRAMMDSLGLWRQHYSQPLLLGISRKRFLQLYTGENRPQERDAISASLARQAVQAGFNIVRTHAVTETRQALTAS